MQKLAYRKTAYGLFSDLDERSKDIITKRFGFETKEPFTLERIGKEHHITRERVRQIVDDAIRTIKEKIKKKQVKSALFDIFSYFSDTLGKSGNLKKEDLLLKSLGDPESFPYITFLLHLGDQFLKHKETNDVHRYWALEKEVVERVSNALKQLLGHLEKTEEIMELEQLKKVLDKEVSPNFVSVLEVSKHIMKTHDGKWGLKRWPHVYPKTIRDKAYLVLKNVGKPLHFREVAKFIDEFQRKFPSLKIKQILPQTVHNELIKDKRFVLVGRGTYALSDWGYKSGTVKDIIVAILKEEGKKLTKEEIIKKTLAQRQVKETTILLNLQDRKVFARDELGRYYSK